MSTTVQPYRTAVLTTANQLTILRIVFVPVFIILLAYREVGWALCTFVAAGITDVLDGIIARRLRQKTSIGAVLDPLADKLLMTANRRDRTFGATNGEIVTVSESCPT